MNKTNVVELYEKRKVEIEKEANDSLKSLEKLISQSEVARDKRESNIRSEITRLNAEEGFQISLTGIHKPCVVENPGHLKTNISLFVWKKLIH